MACDIADVQLRELDKQAFGVMATPGTEHLNVNYVHVHLDDDLICRIDKRGID